MAKRRKGPTLIQQSRRVSAEQKAIWHQVQGSGKAKVLRPFLGVSADDIRAIEELVGGRIEVNLGRTR